MTKRYQRDNQNPYIEEEQTTQWTKEKKTNNDLQNIHIKLKIELSVIFFWRNGFCNVVIICDISHFANVLHQNRRKQVMSRFYKINTMGATCVAGTAHHSGAPEFTHGF
jgi:hypothetical protein